MAQIIGQIDSLKQIRNRLHLKGIDRFNSTGEMSTFLENYESEKTAIYQLFETELEDDIQELKEKIKYNNIFIDEKRKHCSEKIKTKITNNLSKIYYYQNIKNDSFLSKSIGWIMLKLLPMYIGFLRNSFVFFVDKSTYRIERKIRKQEKQLHDFLFNKEYHVTERSADKIKDLEYTKEAVLKLNPLIAGAIGENLVVKEIEKLSDDYILINDFSLKFDPPIYDRKKDDRIFSIQIDHLLISKSGIYILETKNWSKKSIMSAEMRSPVDQVERTGYALFTFLNSRSRSDSIKLKNHRWGKRRKIGIRSIIVMINEKPKVDFKFVSIKTLNELNNYIQFFEPIYTDDEFKVIFEGLINLYYKNSREGYNETSLLALCKARERSIIRINVSDN